MKRDMVRVAVAAALMAGTIGTASAYEAIDVTGGGSLTGTVKYAGTPPAPEKFAVTKDNAVCGNEKTKPDLVVGSDLTFEYAGQHELKGIPDRWQLYRVVPDTVSV